MKTFKHFFKSFDSLISKHSNVIFPTMAGMSFAASVISAVAVTPKAIHILNEEYLEDCLTDGVSSELARKTLVEDPTIAIRYTDNFEIVKSTWRLYFPSATSFVLGVAFLIVGGHIQAKNEAAYMAAYAITNDALKTYRDKVKDILGNDEQEKIESSIIQDHINNSDPNFTGLGSEGYLCYESLTGRYFRSTEEEIRKSQNDFNHELLNDVYLNLNDWAYYLGLPPIQTGDLLGWNSDKLLDIRISSLMAPTGEPCIAVKYTTIPSPYFKN